MDQLLFMWTLLPEEYISWVFNLVILAGVIGMLAGKLARWIPFFGVYIRPIKYLGLLLLMAGLFLKGGELNNAAWEAKVKEVEMKLKKAEDQSRNENIVIQEKIVKETEVIVKRGKDIIKTVEIPGPEKIKEITKDMSEAQKAEYEKRLDEYKQSIANCPIPQIVIDAHNKAASPVGDKK